MKSPSLHSVIEELRGYRHRNEHFDRLVGFALSNETIAKGIRSVSRQASVNAHLAYNRPKDVSDSSRNYDRVFFLIGEMRSGTSWLRRILAAHPEIACGHEGSFFGLEWEREDIPVYTAPVSSLARALAVSDDLRVWHDLPWNRWTEERRNDLRNLTRLSIDYFLNKEVVRTGKRVVGDKSPQHTACLDEMFEIYPDAKVVHIVRDGRDVAVSAMTHWWRLANDRKDGIFELTPEELDLRDRYHADRTAFVGSGTSMFTEDRLAQLARRWSHRVGKARSDGRELYGDNYLEVHYEDLVGETAPNLERILAHLDVRRGEPVLQRCVKVGSFERSAGRERGEENAHSFFRKGVAGDWKNVFNDRDREIYAENAGERLAEFGYGADGKLRIGV